MKWLRSALTDERGAYDIAYVSMAGVSVATLGAIPFMCMMSALAYFRCAPKVTDTLAVVQCVYDPMPLGMAVGAVAGGFATALIALAGYMAATRRPSVQQVPQTVTTVNNL